MKQKKKRRKRGSLEEGKEGKMTKPDDDTAYLGRDLLEALKRSDEKWIASQEGPMKKWKATQERLTKKSKTAQKRPTKEWTTSPRKADEMLEKFMLVTNTVGSQIQGMNSSIVKMQEMNEKIKEEGGDRFNQFDERITNMERESWTWTKKSEQRK